MAIRENLANDQFFERIFATHITSEPFLLVVERLGASLADIDMSPNSLIDAVSVALDVGNKFHPTPQFVQCTE